MKILSVPLDHCGTHNNFLKKFSKNYTLYGVYIYSNFDIRLNRLTTRKHIFINQKLFKDKKNYFCGPNFINLSENLIK